LIYSQNMKRNCIIIGFLLLLIASVKGQTDENLAKLQTPLLIHTNTSDDLNVLKVESLIRALKDMEKAAYIMIK